jgi:hypothetical protein
MNISRRKLIANLSIAGGTFLGSRLLPTGFNPIFDSSLAATTTSAPSPTRWETSAANKKALAKEIVWLSWEPPQFLERRGDHFDDEPLHYQRMLDSSNIKRMADAGVVWGRIFFYKGLGLQYERPNMDLTRAAADLMHQLGIKVSLYFAGTMFIETLYREIPEAQDWEQRDQNNQWVSYGLQTFRRYACPNEPAYRHYLKKILRVGIEEIKADEIAFDNIMLQPEPHSCRCWRCMKAFNQFLRDRYPTKEQSLRRFGLPDVDWVQLDPWENPDDPETVKTLDDPVLQEWIRFRCQSLANYAGDLSDMVKSMNPAVAASFNIKGVFAYNRYWTNAVYHPMFAGKVDCFSFDTSGYEAGIDPQTGALISQIRSFKMARQIDASVEDSMRDDLKAAVQMSFGIQKPLPTLPGLPFGAGAEQTFTPLLEFFRFYNARYYTQTQNVADVAVLRNWPSMAFSISATYIPAALMEQVLIQYKIPFDLLFDEELKNLDRYAAIILAGQECVSDDQAQMLLNYARGGGSLILAGNTGVYNQWREKRHVDPFNSAPDHLDWGDWSDEKLLTHFPAQRTEGKGRVVYIPHIVQLSGDNNEIAPGDWVLPGNHKKIYQTIIQALPSGPSLQTTAPLTTVAELVTRSTTTETIVHFVNFEMGKRLSPFDVTIRKQFPGPVKSVACFSMITDDPVAVDFQDSDNLVKFTAGAMGIYSMIVISQ